LSSADFTVSKKPLRVLVLSPFFSPNVGGVETHLDDLCAYLQKSGHGVSVITYQPLTTNVKSEKFESKQNFEIYRINWVGYNLFHKLEPYPMLEFIYLTPLLFIYSFSFMVRGRNTIDVIHAHGINAAFVAKLLKGLFRKRVVVSIHAIYNLCKKPLLAKLMKISLSSSDEVLTLANKSKVELLTTGLDVNSVKVYTYWVNQEIFKPMDTLDCKKELGFSNKFVVLFVGRLLEIKGVKILLNVAARLADKKDIAFVFVGDGPLSNEVSKASANLENVFYAGKVENKKLCQYYNAADISIVPSLYEEGFGRVILEALSCGTPVMASNKGGIPEAMDPQVGILIDPNVDEIQQVIVTLYANPAILTNLRRNCRIYAEKKFSENNAKLIENAYSS
jgi:glycosyltransferase involved in cell wall biosynthesis